MSSTSPELVHAEGLRPREEPKAIETQAPSPEPDLRIRTLDELVSDVRRQRSPLGTAASIGAHVALVGAVVALPLWMDTSLPETAAVRAFFVTPLELAPPPPPPPPPAPAARAAAQVPAAPLVERADGFVAPIEAPAEIIPEAGLDLGIEGGVSGGVEGGVPGGVVGGIIGGLPEAPPAPTLKPLRAGGLVREPQKLKGFAPVYPDAARNAGVEGVVILECVISPQGRVAEVKVLRGIPLLEQAAVDAVKEWVYTPTLMDGVPVPVLLTVTVRFGLRS
ncbi:MAG: energy transducer TonB [Acidobacteria bacterium]|jgi:protein TonB|nr:energy transducer TonB [Acidobacteriota bacterium]